MDCYKTESEFIDSLDFLSPPVKRISSKDLFGCSYNSQPNNIQLFRSIRNKFTPKEKVVEYKQERQQAKKARRTVKTGESSTSLILKKTSERKILQRHTVVSYTSLHTSNLNNTTPGKTYNHLEHKGKPLIKVTVIPKSDQIQTAKLLRKRRNIPTRVQSTSSNQENSVKTKNLYLVVAGRRNKIYEIKTTGSATFSSGHKDYNNSKNDIPNERLSNVKHLIQSLNMDQKPKKDKKELMNDELERNTLANENDSTQYASKGIDPYAYEGHMYSSNVESRKRPLNRSRVRIYGQLGLTDDDRYVLRYGATVNDKPVTDFAQLNRDFLPQVPPSVYTPYEASPEVTKEASVQVNYNNYYHNQHPTVSGFMYRKESQGTQVNFNISTATRNFFKAARVDKDIQCSCSNVSERVIENKCRINTLKETHSPVVIISVYPKSPEDMFKYATDTCRHKTHTDAEAQCVPNLKTEKSTNAKEKSKRSTESKIDEIKKNTSIKKYNKRSPNNRSLSPLQNKTKGKLPEKETETIVLKTRTDTPDRYKAMRVIKNKILEKDRGTEVPASFKILKPVQRSKPPLKRNSNTCSQERGTNTDHVKVKKNLVDNYAKQLADQLIKNRDMIPARLDNSKVTINIEGEQEYYSVLFDQSKLSNNLRVNKTMKYMNSQNSHRVMSPSLENLLLLPEKEPEAKPVSLYDKEFDESSMNKRVSGMTIRDSLEITHRREDKHVSDVTSIRNYIPAHCIEDLTDNSEFIAPIKHYTGDDCSICDPVERDKQIRELLGVNKSAHKSPQAHPPAIDEYSLHCCYRRQCEKKQVAEINLIKYCPILGSLPKISGQKSCPKSCYPNALCEEQFCCGHVSGDEEAVNNEHKNIHKQNQAMTRNAKNSAIYQQLILNRNIQIFLQVEQLSKQKPIILSRKQYDKVKKTIQTTLNHKCKCKEKLKRQERDFSDISVGEVRKRGNKNIQLHFDQEIQTDMVWGSFQGPCKTSKVVSKVGYFSKTPRSKHFHEREQDNNVDYDNYQTFEAMDGYYQLYPQKESGDSIELCQRTCPAIMLEPGNTEYNRPNSRSNELRKNKELGENYTPSIRENYTVKKQFQEHEKHYKSIENCSLQKDEHIKPNNLHNKESEEYVKPNEIKYFERRENSTFMDKFHNGYEERRQSHEVCLNKQNKKYKENREYWKLNTKYCVDHGKHYHQNKKCCKDIEDQQNINNESFKDFERHQQIEKCAKEFREYSKSLKNNMETVDDSHHRKLCDKLSKYRVISNRMHHRGCGKHNKESEDPYQINIHEANLDSESRKSNKIEEYSATKREYLKPRNEYEDRVKEYNKLLAERTQRLGGHEESLRERLPYIAAHESNISINITHLKSKEYEKNKKESGYKQYDSFTGDFKDNFRSGITPNEYFGKSVEYCRLDIEHHKNNDKLNNDKCSERTKELSKHNGEYDNQKDKEEQVRKVPLYDFQQHPNSLQADPTDQSIKNNLSSLEIHYTSVAYLNKIELSTSELAVVSDSSLCHVNSIQTIYRGRRKSPTPNLGTSMYSLYSENGLHSNKSAKFIMAPREEKPSKRPFLRRLMSCLVMRSTRDSDLKLPITPVQEMPTVNSSVDSYHINTSLGAVEVSSSIYDTSASFYSNHTILPINSKIKRGFFNSVRGFLTYRRS